jgi:hypothetical protein
VDGPGIGAGREVDALCVGEYTAYVDFQDDPADLQADSDEESDTFVQDKNNFKPETWVISPRPYRRFWKFAKEENIKIKHVTTPYTCALCDRYPVATAEYSTAQTAFAADRGNEQLRKKMIGLRDELTSLDRHRLQLANQRSYVQTRVDALPPKTPSCFKIVVIEDYMSQFTILGGKCNDLIFTILWRDEHGQLQTKYVDNICNDDTRRADSGFTRAVWDFHLREINGN